jgi:hypothetical protein
VKRRYYGWSHSIRALPCDLFLFTPFFLLLDEPLIRCVICTIPISTFSTCAGGLLTFYLLVFGLEDRSMLYYIGVGIFRANAKSFTTLLHVCMHACISPRHYSPHPSLHPCGVVPLTHLQPHESLAASPRGVGLLISTPIGPRRSMQLPVYTCGAREAQAPRMWVIGRFRSWSICIG